VMLSPHRVVFAAAFFILAAGLLPSTMAVAQTQERITISGSTTRNEGDSVAFIIEGRDLRGASYSQYDPVAGRYVTVTSTKNNIVHEMTGVSSGDYTSTGCSTETVLVVGEDTARCRVDVNILEDGLVEGMETLTIRMLRIEGQASDGEVVSSYTRTGGGRPASPSVTLATSPSPFLTSPVA